MQVGDYDGRRCGNDVRRVYNTWVGAVAELLGANINNTISSVFSFFDVMMAPTAAMVDTEPLS
jgi:hypothetical protein